MKLMVRIIGLYILYLSSKIRNCGIVNFRGFSVVYADKKSKIEFSSEGGIVVNSHPLSNLLGMSQRAIFVARHGGEIHIGKGCAISGSTIYSMESIRIGDETFIGANCKIMDSDHHSLFPEERRKHNPDQIKKKPIVIGNGCFIGADSIILKGTVLGDHCVVGAGSVVCGTFPADVIIAGNPAKIIKPLR